jgi:hypothetical protein
MRSSDSNISAVRVRKNTCTAVPMATTFVAMTTESPRA